MASTAGQRRAKQRAAADRGPVLTVTVDGKKYSWSPQDMTALDVRALREELGMSYNGLLAQARQDMDVDLIAAVVWMARRVNGERDLSWAEVAGSIAWNTPYTITDDTDAAVDDTDGDGHPET